MVHLILDYFKFKDKTRKKRTETIIPPVLLTVCRNPSYCTVSKESNTGH